MLEFPQQIEQSSIKAQKVSFQRKKWTIAKGDKFILNRNFFYNHVEIYSSDHIYLNESFILDINVNNSFSMSLITN